MLNPFKIISKKKIGGLLLIFVIIIAFGFGGFGGGFSTGNQNNIAKINNTNISTQDFMDYLNESGLSQQVIKENIDKNIIEELLSTLVSKTLLDLEIEELNLSITEDLLIKKIENNKSISSRVPFEEIVTNLG
jgi:peptidyl-prolyl cis-trans isomerase D